MTSVINTVFARVTAALTAAVLFLRRHVLPISPRAGREAIDALLKASADLDRLHNDLAWEEVNGDELTKVAFTLAAALSIGDTLNPEDPGDATLIAAVEAVTTQAAGWLDMISSKASSTFTAETILRSLDRCGKLTDLPVLDADEVGQAAQVALVGNA